MLSEVRVIADAACPAAYFYGTPAPQRKDECAHWTLIYHRYLPNKEKRAKFQTTTSTTQHSAPLNQKTPEAHPSPILGSTAFSIRYLETNPVSQATHFRGC